MKLLCDRCQVDMSAPDSATYLKAGTTNYAALCIKLPMLALGGGEQFLRILRDYGPIESVNVCWHCVLDLIGIPKIYDMKKEEEV